MSRHLLLLPLLLLSAATGRAQDHAIRFILPEFTTVYAGSGPWRNFMLGMGYDRIFDDRLSMGVDVMIDVQRSLDGGGENSGEGIEVLYAGYRGLFSSADKVLGVQYRTAYAFGDIGSTHAYLGTFVGFRSIKRAVFLSTVEDLSGNWTYDSPFISTAQGSATVFPIGLRAGLRGGLDAGFADIYAQWGLVLGAGKSMFQPSYLSGEGFDLASTAITVGFAYGVGW